jgi:hypothetical protein
VRIARGKSTRTKRRSAKAPKSSKTMAWTLWVHLDGPTRTSAATPNPQPKNQDFKKNLPLATNNLRRARRIIERFGPLLTYL